MANPQIENGHIDLANEIADKLCSYRIPGEEWLILWTILRKTYGWHKKQDEISITQFQKITGMKRASVYRSIKGLLAKKLIGISKDANSYINLYRFNKDFDQWIAISKKATPISISANKSISKSATHKRKERNNYIETISKSANTPNPNVKTFIDYWHVSFKSKFSQPYIFNGSKEGTLIKSLLKTIPIDDLKNKAEIFFTCNDDFIKKSGYTIGVFYSQINKLSTLKRDKWK